MPRGPTRGIEPRTPTAGCCRGGPPSGGKRTAPMPGHATPRAAGASYGRAGSPEKAATTAARRKAKEALETLIIFLLACGAATSSTSTSGAGSVRGAGAGRAAGTAPASWGAFGTGLRFSCEYRNRKPSGQAWAAWTWEGLVGKLPAGRTAFGPEERSYVEALSMMSTTGSTVAK